MTTAAVTTLVLLFSACIGAFTSSSNRSARWPFLLSPETDADTTTEANRRRPLFMSSNTDSDIETSTPSLIDPDVSSKFKILTCSSTSCAKKRRDCGLDEFATYGAFYGLIQENAPNVQLEESPCLGSCQMAPCVGIEHDDYEGTVALEGMIGNEFTERV